MNQEGPTKGCYRKALFEVFGNTAGALASVGDAAGGDLLMLKDRRLDVL